MFDRFEDECKKAMMKAREEAQRLDHDRLEAEHILLGLLDLPSCTAVLLLREAGIDVAALRARALAALPPRKSGIVTMGQLPFTVEAKRVLESCMGHAENAGESRIGTECLLLGYASTRGSVVVLDPSVLQKALESLFQERRDSGRNTDRAMLSRIANAHDLLKQVELELLSSGEFPYATRVQEIDRQLLELLRELRQEPGN